MEKKRILLVDDDPFFGKFITAILQKSEYGFSAVESIAEAKSALMRAEAPQVLLIDIELKDENGLDLLQFVTKEYPDVLCVILTGHRTLENSIIALKNGAYDFLTKPIEAHGLNNLLSRCFEKVKLREERLHGERMISLGRKMEAISRATASIAHDFNNVLTAIMGTAELLLDSIETIGSEQDIADVKEILNSANRGHEITQQLLSFSSRRQVVEGQVVLDEKLKEIEPLLKRLAGKNVLLKYQLDAKEKTINIGHEHFEQIMFNLIMNAKDAINKTGNIVVSSSFIEKNLPEHLVGVVDKRKQDIEYTMVKVQDTGHGMDEETLVRVFEPFFTTKENSESEGTGMSVVYHTVKRCGGYIDVESSPGEGATFSLYFPVL